MTGGRREVFEPEHEAFRESVALFCEREVAPFFQQWEAEGAIPRELFAKAAEAGLLGIAAPEELGGAGLEDFRFNAVVAEETARAGAGGLGACLAVHADVCVPLLSAAVTPRRDEWLAALAGGELLGTYVFASAGGDGGPGFALSGSGSERTLSGSGLVYNARNAGLALLRARDGEGGGERLLALELGTPGLSLEPLDFATPAIHGVAALRADGVALAAESELGDDSARLAGRAAADADLSLALLALGGARACLAETVEYVQSRRVFGQALAGFDNTRFAIAELAAQVEVATAYADACLAARAAAAGDPAACAIARTRCAELYAEAADAGLQLHGGYGYMWEYPIARAYAEAAFLRLYGGADERTTAAICAAAGL